MHPAFQHGSNAPCVSARLKCTLRFSMAQIHPAFQHGSNAPCVSAWLKCTLRFSTAQMHPTFQHGSNAPCVSARLECILTVATASARDSIIFFYYLHLVFHQGWFAPCVSPLLICTLRFINTYKVVTRPVAFCLCKRDQGRGLSSITPGRRLIYPVCAELP